MDKENSIKEESKDSPKDTKEKKEEEGEEKVGEKGEDKESGSLNRKIIDSEAQAAEEEGENDQIQVNKGEKINKDDESQ